MKYNKFIFFTVFTCFSYAINSFPFVLPLNNAIKSDECTKKYKILKIKSVKNIYIIYAERNDTIFKILSKQVKAKDTNIEKIRTKREYYLSLETLFPRCISGNELPRPGTTGAMGLFYYGVNVLLETEKGIWDLFEATNLKGLYIEKENIVSD